MKAVLISIKPRWCSLITRGKKTIEIRKTRPKIETPFKCYIYMTKGFASYSISNGMRCHNNGGMSVIGEFLCDYIFPIRIFDNGTIQNYNYHRLQDSCVDYDDIVNYIGRGRSGYGWHIKDLKIYDRPLELRQFVIKGDCDCKNCHKCYWMNPGNGYNVEDDCDLAYEFMGYGDSVKPLFRAPQSWCYVEEWSGTE